LHPAGSYNPPGGFRAVAYVGVARQLEATSEDGVIRWFPNGVAADEPELLEDLAAINDEWDGRQGRSSAKS
jgi:hypothetical protein